MTLEDGENQLLPHHNAVHPCHSIQQLRAFVRMPAHRWTSTHGKQQTALGRYTGSLKTPKISGAGRPPPQITRSCRHTLNSHTHAHACTHACTHSRSLSHSHMITHAHMRVQLTHARTQAHTRVTCELPENKPTFAESSPSPLNDASLAGPLQRLHNSGRHALRIRHWLRGREGEGHGGA